MRFEQAFHDEQAAYYDELLADPEPIRTYFDRLNAEIFDLVKEAPFVVDLCAGTGKSSLPLLERGVPVVAVDVSGQMLQVYKQKAAGLSGLMTVQADATQPPLETESCLAILMIGGLHHIPDQKVAVLNACRALKPGGLLIIHEPIIMGRTHWLLPLLRNVDGLTNVPRLVRSILRRLHLLDQPISARANPTFTPYERPFQSADQLMDLLPPTMHVMELRSRMMLSDYTMGRHLRWTAPLIVALDNWVSRYRDDRTGNAIWGVFRKPHLY